MLQLSGNKIGEQSKKNRSIAPAIFLKGKHGRFKGQALEKLRLKGCGGENRMKRDICGKQLTKRTF